MKTYYLVDRKTWEENHQTLLHESHWVETEDPSKIMLVCYFSHQTNQNTWEKLPGVQYIPHPLLGTSHPLHSALHKHHAMMRPDRL
jgi:hypothetical protein